MMLRITTLSDSELLDMLRIDNREAFTELYSRYWKRLFTVAANKTRMAEEAEEIVQDIFISLWQRRRTIKITTTLNAYLAVSVKYRVIKFLAKQHQYFKYTEHSFIHLPTSANSTEDRMEFEELKSRLEHLVANLPEKCRLVFKASREEGLSHKQIADSYGISEKTVEAHIGKALKTLRTGLGQILL